MERCLECTHLLAELDGDPDRIPAGLRHKLEREPCRRCIETYQKTVSLCRRALQAPAPLRDLDTLLSSLRSRLLSG